MSPQRPAGRLIGGLPPPTWVPVELGAVLHLCGGETDRQLHPGEVDAAAPERDQLTEAQLRERGQQAHEPVSRWMPSAIAKTWSSVAVGRSGALAWPTGPSTGVHSFSSSASHLRLRGDAAGGHGADDRESASHHRVGATAGRQEPPSKSLPAALGIRQSASRRTTSRQRTTDHVVSGGRTGAVSASSGVNRGQRRSGPRTRRRGGRVSDLRGT